MSIDMLRRMASEMGPLDPNIGAILETADGEFAVAVGDEAITMTLSETLGLVVLSVDLGVAPADKALAIYEFLLTYAAGWRQTGGLAFHLTGPGGTLVMNVPVAMNTLDTRLLVTIVTNLAARAAILRTLIAAGAADGTAQNDPPTAAAASMIRV